MLIIYTLISGIQDILFYISKIYSPRTTKSGSISPTIFCLLYFLDRKAQFTDLPPGWATIPSLPLVYPPLSTDWPGLQSAYPSHSSGLLIYPLPPKGKAVGSPPSGLVTLGELQTGTRVRCLCKITCRIIMGRSTSFVNQESYGGHISCLGSSGDSEMQGGSTDIAMLCEFSTSAY